MMRVNIRLGIMELSTNIRKKLHYAFNQQSISGIFQRGMTWAGYLNAAISTLRARATQMAAGGKVTPNHP